MAVKKRGGKGRNNINNLPCVMIRGEKDTIMGENVAQHFPKWVTATYILILLTVSVILFISPFRQGLYFPGDMLVFQAIIFVSLALWLLTKLILKDFLLAPTALDYSLFALLFFYLIAIFSAINTREAIAELLKVASYCAIFFVIRDICRKNFISLNFRFLKKKEKNNGMEKITVKGNGDIPEDASCQDETPSLCGGKEIPSSLLFIIYALFFSGMAVVIASLGAASGIWEIEGAYLMGRIATPLQYANAGGAYLMALYFLVIGLSIITKKMYIRGIFLACATITFICIILTFSRGVWLVIPLVAALFIIGAGKGSRLRSFFYFSASAAAGTIFAFRLDSVFKAENVNIGRGVTEIASALFCILILFIFTELFMKIKIRRRKIIAFSALTFIAIATIIFLGWMWRSPLHLSRSTDSAPGDRYIEQIVHTGERQGTYNLTMEVKSALHERVESPPPYVWRLLVNALSLDETGIGFRGEILLDEYYGAEGNNENWQNKEYSFYVAEGVDRFTVRIYNHYPGTAVTARNVSIVREGEGGEKLRPEKLLFFYHRLMPQTLYTRLFSLTDRIAATQRFAHYGDAMAIIGDYWLTGAGGNSWEALYPGYAKWEYRTKEIHNHFLKVWMDAGIFALLSYLAIWIILLIKLVLTLRSTTLTTLRKQYLLTLSLAAISLVIHSVLDFALSLPAITISLFIYLAAAQSLVGKQSFKPASNKKLSVILCIVALLTALGLTVWSEMLFIAHKVNREAIVRLEEREFLPAKELFEEAAKYDSYNAANYYFLADIYEQIAKIEKNHVHAAQNDEKALNYLEKAVQLEPFNPEYNRKYGLFLISYGEIEKGLYHTGRAANIQPFKGRYLIQDAAARLSVAEYHLQRGEVEEGAKLLNQIIAQEDKLQQQPDASSEIRKLLQKTRELLNHISLNPDFYSKKPEK